MTPKLLLAVSVAVFVPAVVGVPEIRPLVAMDRPPGKLVPPKTTGVLPLAVTVLLNVTPAVPLKELVEVKTGAEPELGSSKSAILVEERRLPFR